MFTFHEIEAIAQSLIDQYTLDRNRDMMHKAATGPADWEMSFIAGRLSGAGTFAQMLMDLIKKREEELNEGS